MNDLERLRANVTAVLAPYGLRRVSLFGSAARGDMTPNSDIDLLVEFDQPRLKPIGLMTWVRLEQTLSERLRRKVDLVSATAVRAHLRPYIEKDAIVIYESQK